MKKVSITPEIDKLIKNFEKCISEFGIFKNYIIIEAAQLSNNCADAEYAWRAKAVKIIGGVLVVTEVIWEFEEELPEADMYPWKDEKYMRLSGDMIEEYELKDNDEVKRANRLF